jgi:hypothetical protein
LLFGLYLCNVLAMVFALAPRGVVLRSASERIWFAVLLLALPLIAFFETASQPSFPLASVCHECTSALNKGLAVGFTSAIMLYVLLLPILLPAMRVPADLLIYPRAAPGAPTQRLWAFLVLPVVLVGVNSVLRAVFLVSPYNPLPFGYAASALAIVFAVGSRLACPNARPLDEASRWALGSTVLITLVGLPIAIFVLGMQFLSDSETTLGKVAVVLGFNLIILFVRFVFIPALELFYTPRNVPVVFFTVQLFDDMFSSTVFVVIEDIDVAFIILAVLQLVKEAMRDTGVFHALLERLSPCFALSRGPLIDRARAESQRLRIAEQNILSSVISGGYLLALLFVEEIFESRSIGSNAVVSNLRWRERRRLLAAYAVLFALQLLMALLVRRINLRKTASLHRSLADAYVDAVRSGSATAMRDAKMAVAEWFDAFGKTTLEDVIHVHRAALQSESKAELAPTASSAVEADAVETKVIAKVLDAAKNAPQRLFRSYLQANWRLLLVATVTVLFHVIIRVPAVKVTARVDFECSSACKFTNIRR